MKHRTAGGAVDRATAVKSGIKGTASSARVCFYDSKAGILILTVLALVLWWIPYIGQMIPGYVGGRRAGSMSRGIFSAVIGTVLLLAMAVGGSVVLSWLISTPTISDCMVSYPALQSLFDSATEYFAEFAVVTEAGFSVTGDYLLMAVFAVIGGAMANQSRKETELIVASAVAKTEPLPPRSVRAAAAGRTLSFESYSDMAAFSVNSMGGDVKKDAAKPAEPETVSEPDTPVTTTSVDASESIPVGSCATSSEATATSSEEVHASEPRKKAKEKRVPFDDYEFF